MFRLGGSLGTTAYYQIGAYPTKQDIWLGIFGSRAWATLAIDAMNHTTPRAIHAAAVAARTELEQIRIPEADQALALARDQLAEDG